MARGTDVKATSNTEEMAGSYRKSGELPDILPRIPEVDDLPGSDSSGSKRLASLAKTGEEAVDFLFHGVRIAQSLGNLSAEHLTVSDAQAVGCHHGRPLTES